MNDLEMAEKYIAGELSVLDELPRGGKDFFKAKREGLEAVRRCLENLRANRPSLTLTIPSGIYNISSGGRL